MTPKVSDATTKAGARNIKMKMEKDMAEEISKFKSNYQRTMQDKDFDLHRRVLNVEEDESRIKMGQDRLREAE